LTYRSTVRWETPGNRATARVIFSVLTGNRICVAAVFGPGRVNARWSAASKASPVMPTSCCSFS